MATYGFTEDKARVAVIPEDRILVQATPAHFPALSRVADQTFTIPKPSTVGASQAILIGGAYTTFQGQIVQAAAPIFLGSSNGWEQLSIALSPSPTDPDLLIASIMRFGTNTAEELFDSVTFAIYYAG